MFQFSGFALLAEWYHFMVPGCPIRKSSDIAVICTSPKLIAAYHVLHRLWEPRHPPCALTYFLLLYNEIKNLALSNTSKNVFLDPCPVSNSSKLVGRTEWWIHPESNRKIRPSYSKNVQYFKKLMPDITLTLSHSHFHTHTHAFILRLSCGE
jgi:hypothetical protein